MKKFQGTIAGLVVVAALWAQPADAMKIECFQQYARNSEACAAIPTFEWRTLCGLDAALEFLGCLYGIVRR